MTDLKQLIESLSPEARQAQIVSLDKQIAELEEQATNLKNQKAIFQGGNFKGPIKSRSRASTANRTGASNSIREILTQAKNRPGLTSVALRDAVAAANPQFNESSYQPLLSGLVKRGEIKRTDTEHGPLFSLTEKGMHQWEKKNKKVEAKSEKSTEESAPKSEAPKKASAESSATTVAAE